MAESNSIEFKTLENISLEELTKLFNHAFDDYFVKVNLTPQILAEKIKSEDIRLNFSVGVYTNERPAGFILHAVRNFPEGKQAYNAGTGVIPNFRGQNLTHKMYEFILPKLKEAEVSSSILEVMEQNVPAIKSYHKAGFQKITNLECFRGKVSLNREDNHISIQKINHPNFQELQTFWEWEPTWQHSVETIQKSTTYECYGAYIEGELAGYITANITTGRVAQFAVNSIFRRQGIGTKLFQNITRKCPDGITAINVDDSLTTHFFLTSLGLKPFLRQHLMKLSLV